MKFAVVYVNVMRIDKAKPAVTATKKQNKKQINKRTNKQKKKTKRKHATGFTSFNAVQLHFNCNCRRTQRSGHTPT